MNEKPPNAAPDALPLRWDRRSFLGTAPAAAALLAANPTLRSSLAAGMPASSRPGGLVDVNVTLGRWPLRRLPLDETRKLVAKLRRLGVAQAWAGTFDGLLHKDLATANARLVEECHQHAAGLLLPFGSIDPTRPDWEEELRRCVEIHRMPGLRLFPNYHGYRLDHPAFAALLHRASACGLLLQIALVMEDERMMHPLMRVDPVDPTPLTGIARTVPNLRLVLVNSLRTLRAKPLLDLLATDRISVEISMLEGLGGLASLLEQMPAGRVLFGSHAPLFYPEAATLKLQESALSPKAMAAITRDNALGLLRVPPRPDSPTVPAS